MAHRLTKTKCEEVTMPSIKGVKCHVPECVRKTQHATPTSESDRCSFYPAPRSVVPMPSTTFGTFRGTPKHPGNSLETRPDNMRRKFIKVPPKWMKGFRKLATRETKWSRNCYTASLGRLPVDIRVICVFYIIYKSSCWSPMPHGQPRDPTFHHKRIKAA